MTLRKALFWLHLIAGISAGIVILIMSVTGVLLTYEKQMLAWADKPYTERRDPAEGTRLPAPQILANVAEASGAMPTALTVYAGSAAVSAAAGGTTYFVDASTGEILGKSAPRLRAFFRFVTDWHRYVALSGDSRPTGKAITGAANLGFLFIVVSGMVLWWPRVWTRQSLRSVTWFKGGLAARARNFNWHNVFGFWTAVPLFLVVLSATVISYPWASNTVYRITGTEPPPPARGANAGAAPQAQPADLSSLVMGLDQALAVAETQAAGWRVISMRLPASSDAPLVFTLDKGTGGQPQLRSTLTVDRAGQIASLETYDDQNLGRRSRTWLRFMHTGEFYGFIGQTIAGLASLSAVMLVWTGLALALHRLRSWAKNRRTRPQEKAVGPLVPSAVARKREGAVQ